MAFAAAAAALIVALFSSAVAESISGAADISDSPKCVSGFCLQKGYQEAYNERRRRRRVSLSPSSFGRQHTGGQALHDQLRPTPMRGRVNKKRAEESRSDEICHQCQFNKLDLAGTCLPTFLPEVGCLWPAANDRRRLVS